MSLVEIWWLSLLWRTLSFLLAFFSWQAIPMWSSIALLQFPHPRDWLCLLFSVLLFVWITQCKVTTFTQVSSHITITSLYMCLWEPCREALPFEKDSWSSMPEFVTSVPGSVPCCGPSCTTMCPIAMSLGDFATCWEITPLSHELGFVEGPYQDRVLSSDHSQGILLKQPSLPLHIQF